jgi:hypothetical protein
MLSLKGYVTRVLGEFHRDATLIPALAWFDPIIGVRTEDLGPPLDEVIMPVKNIATLGVIVKSSS